MKIPTRIRRVLSSNSTPQGNVVPDAKIAFVVGTGRSGTHFLTKCLLGSPEINDCMGGKENPAIFPLVASSAADLSSAPDNLRKARKRYRDYCAKVGPRWFLDQSHPNIWFAEYWSATFPKARFLGIVRNPYSVVASMMKHDGVRRWIEQWERYPVPNLLLGIAPSNEPDYRAMNMVQRCTWRWMAHVDRLRHLEKTLGERMIVVEYEALCDDPHAVLSPVAACLGIEANFALPAIDKSTSTKYQELGSSSIDDISAMLESKGMSQYLMKTG